MSRNQARLAILNHLLAFPTIGNTRWASDWHDEAQVGDLVSLSSAPVSKWYLSWLREIDCTDTGFTRYLLESIEDGELCWWHNVGLNFYDRTEIAQRPFWQWSDRQYALNNRWIRGCQKERDAYIYLPTWMEFDGEAVTLGVRVRHGFDNGVVKRKFENWKKLYKADMLAFYDEAVEEFKAKPKKMEGY